MRWHIQDSPRLCQVIHLSCSVLTSRAAAVRSHDCLTIPGVVKDVQLDQVTVTRGSHGHSVSHDVARKRAACAPHSYSSVKWQPHIDQNFVK
ncbi:hypothetical protein RRG08_060945 [Elysia crispata]|uniref:Uncharacterized protein n=1 Tax=Elysia crispata TaxID=231223 RepID=A0AAE1AUH3_9GAST|nr:hypothetical protein RRG08_060945 [Elysia crispata]